MATTTEEEDAINNALTLASLFAKVGESMENKIPAFCEEIASGKTADGKKLTADLSPDRGWIVIGVKGDQYIKFPLRVVLAGMIEAASMIKAARADKGDFGAAVTTATATRPAGT